MEKKYDYLVIGSGPAGHVSAIRAAQLGMKVALVEKDESMLGGVCLNEGCIPAKSLFTSAKIVDLARKNKDILALEEASISGSISKIVERSLLHTETLRKGLAFLLKKNKIDYINGFARFIDNYTVSVSSGGEAYEIKSDKFLVAAGSTSAQLDGMPFDGKTIITSREAIRLKDLPRSILIVGGGSIGTEFASYFNLLGSKVTVAELEDALLPGEDWEISRRLHSIFRQKDIEVFTSSRVKGIKGGGSSQEVAVETKDGETMGEYDLVLISVGRIPSTGGIGLEDVGVETDDKGFIRVNGKMETTVSNIFAAGDVVRTPMLAHMAYAEGEIAAEVAGGASPEAIDHSSVPNAVYMDIEVASVGMTEKEAKAGGEEVCIGKQFFKANGRAVVTSETEGFIKIVASPGSFRLLGVHIIAHGASELIHEFAVAKRNGLTAKDIARSVHAHPTFSETAVDAAKAVFSQPIHG